ncbi:hypothetical protein AnigIFM60653_004553 [Aspergillus niger]|nr:hypothetical protein AnigIFM60653_004553 [Aspergillus niger]
MKISSVLFTALFAALVTAGHVHNDDKVSAHGKMKRQAPVIAVPLVWVLLGTLRLTSGSAAAAVAAKELFQLVGLEDRGNRFKSMAKYALSSGSQSYLPHHVLA